jgi:formylmethanofuran dehydrogenase subunit E
MIDKLVRTLFSSALGVRCRRCNEPLHPQDDVGASEAICLPCRLDPGRAGPTV